MVTELNDISKNIYKLESKNPTVGVLVYMSSGISSSSSLEFLLLLYTVFFVYAACGTYVSILCKVREIDISNDGFEISK